MKTGSDYFYGILLENQLEFIRGMNHKHGGKFYDVLRAWRMKDTLPAYRDTALHKIVLDEFKHKIPKSTISTWLSTIPEILERKEMIDEILETKSVRTLLDSGEKLLTKSEWDYLHMLEGDKLNIEYKMLMEKFKNPRLTGEEIMKLTGCSRRLMQRITHYGRTMIEPYTQKKFIEKNEEIIMKGKQRIHDLIDSIHVGNMRDLKALSGVIDDGLKQNQLLTGGPTERVAHGVDEVFEHMEKKRLELGSEDIQEAEIEVDEPEEDGDFNDTDY